MTDALYSRMLDLLLDTNNCPQMPTDRRYDLSLPIPSDAEEDCILPIDKEPKTGPRPTKNLRDLIQDVPHLNFAATAKLHPDVANDLLHGIDSPAADASHQQHPPAMLTADDIDNYLWEIDNRVAREPEVYGGPSEMLPTLAPLAREPPTITTPVPVAHSKAGASSLSMASRDFALRNPTSVYNWLRKHAPKTFLQDHEGGDDKKEKAHRKAPRVEEEDEEEEKRPPTKKSAGGSARKSSGEGRGSIAVARAKAKNERGTKRSSAAQAKDKRKSLDTTMVDVEEEVGYDGPAPSKGKRKRPADDDTGYRPKGGSSRRPAKKRSKNNSLGGSSAAGGPVSAGAGADEKAEVAVAKHADKIEDEVDATVGPSDTED